MYGIQSLDLSQSSSTLFCSKDECTFLIYLDKMKAKTILLGLLFLSAADFFFIGCSPCDNNPAGWFQLCTLEAKNIDNSGLHFVAASDTVSKEAYVLQLDFTATESDVCSKRTHFLSSGYAMVKDCDPGGFYNYNPVVQVSITSNNDINANLPAGSNLVGEFFAYHHQAFISAESMLFQTYVSDLSAGVSYSLRLMTPPTQSGEHIFTIDVTLEDGKVISAQTSKLYLQ